MSSIIKTAAKIGEELSQPNEKSDAKQEGIQHTKARLREVLTLRLLMSYIYIYIYMQHLFWMFLDHTQRRTTVGRTPLDE